MAHIEHFTFNNFQTNCFVIWDESGKCVIADPGCASDSEISELTGFISGKGLKPTCILLTHCHFDHTYGAAALSRTFGIPVHAGKEEMFTIETTNPMLSKVFGLPLPEEFEISFVSEGDTVEAGDFRFEVLETPGHSAGGLCFLEKNGKTLFSGDTLFAGAIGRTDHPGGDYDAIIKSILEKLVVLDGEIEVVPGHGPTSSIAEEGMTNPFLMPFNEPYEE